MKTVIKRPSSKNDNTGMICGCAGAFLTLIGDILIGANSSLGISTGVEMLDIRNGQ